MRAFVADLAAGTDDVGGLDSIYRHDKVFGKQKEGKAVREACAVRNQ